MKCCVKDICDKRNSGIYLMTDRSALGNPSLLYDGWTDGKISRTQEMLHSCQSQNDQGITHQVFPQAEHFEGFAGEGGEGGWDRICKVEREGRRC